MKLETFPATSLSPPMLLHVPGIIGIIDTEKNVELEAHPLEFSFFKKIFQIWILCRKKISEIRC